MYKPMATNQTPARRFRNTTDQTLYVVEYWRKGRPGTQVQAFTNQADALWFAKDEILYGKPAIVQELPPCPR